VRTTVPETTTVGYTTTGVTNTAYRPVTNVTTGSGEVRFGTTGGSYSESVRVQERVAPSVYYQQSTQPVYVSGQEYATRSAGKYNLIQSWSISQLQQFKKSEELKQ
jgi:hypothetical protein